jgi:hypothetical protein
MTSAVQPFVEIGASGAQRAAVRWARDFDLCDLRVVVAEVEGTVQILFLSDGWPDASGSRKVLSNMFCDAGTADQLRAIAAHLDGLSLSKSEAA